MNQENKEVVIFGIVFIPLFAAAVGYAAYVLSLLWEIPLF